MGSVLFVVHPDRPAAKDLAASARAWWQSRGYEVVEAIDDDDADDDLNAPTEPHAFAISFGGDGTMLRAVQRALIPGTPVVGINLGRMGFLTEVEPAHMVVAFERLVAGEFHIEERMVLSTTVLGVDGSDRFGAPHFALNEAMVERIFPGHTIRVAVGISGKRFLTYVADGLLVCTPTGSTAYNLSARGPVISPSLRAMVLTPVAPHLVFDSSIVLGPDDNVSLTLLEGRPGALVLDGSRMINLVEGDSVVCTAASIAARFVIFGDRHFHAVLRSRFSLADR